MSVKIKEPPKPPDWFDLKKYERAKNLGIEEWHDQLFVRRAAIDVPDKSQSLWAEIRQHGIVPMQPKKVGSYGMLNLLHRGSVSSVSCVNLLNFCRGYAKQLEKEVGTEWINMACALRPFDAYAREMGGDDADLFHNFTVKVDLSYPNQYIIEDFKNWLEDTRKTFRAKGLPTFTEAKARQWSEAKVLPYIDLSRWIEEERSTLTQEEIGDLLFPGQSVDAKRIQRTQQLAQQLLTSDIVSAMMHQAAR